MSDARSVLRNTAFEMLSQVFGNVLSYFLIIFIARELGDVGFGQYSFVFAFIGAAAVFLDIGVGSYFIVYASRHKKLVKKYFHNFMAIRLLTAFICFLIPVVGSFFIGKDVVVMYSIWLGAAAVFFMNIGNAMRYVFIIYERFEYNSIVTVVERILAFGIGIFLLLKYKSLPIFILALLISYFSTVVLSFIFLRRFTTFGLKFDFRLWKSLFVKGFPFFLVALAYMVIQRTDTILLSLLVGDAQTGWYNAAYRIIDILNLFPVVVGSVMVPVLSRLYVENKESMHILLGKSVKYMILIAMPLTIAILLLADRVILFVYKEQFFNSILALKLLIVMEAVVFLNLVLGSTLTSLLEQKRFLLSISIGAVVGLVLNLVLIPKYGFVGAGITAIITQLVIFGLMFYFVRTRVAAIPLLSELWRPAIASTVMAGAIIYLSWLPLWWLTLICIVLYFGVVFLIGGIDRSDISLMVEMAKSAGQLSVSKLRHILRKK